MEHPKQAILQPERFSSLNLKGQAKQLFQRILLQLKITKVVKHWKKLCKNSFNRYKRIEEWVNTEKIYIEDMNLIINQIQKPFRQYRLISEQEEKVLFPNLSIIIMLSQQMYQTMKQFLDTWHPIKTEIAPAVIKLSSFFKIYIEYFNTYEKGKEILSQIQNQKVYKNIEKSLKMDIQSYLIKPIQRPLKYKLLLTDYQKKLRLDHPDYHALTKAIKIYHEVVEKTNVALQNQKHMRRMIQMEAKFKNILQSSRKWKLQFEALFEDELEPCRIYVFTDLLLVVQLKNRNQKNETLLCKMFLDGTSFVETCQEVADEKQWKHVMFVVGKQQVGHFAFSSAEERNLVFAKLSQVINSIHVNQWQRKSQIQKVSSRRSSSARYSKPFFMEDYYEMFSDLNNLKKKFRVTVCGVQRRVVNKCTNSYFVIKLQLPFPEVINQKAFVKYEELVDLEKLLEACLNKWVLVKAQNDQKLKWKSIQELSKQLSKVNSLQLDTKVVEYRAKKIESFLNLVLRNNQTLKTSNLIFHKLKMFQSIYELLIDSKTECQICEICHNGNIISNYETYQKQLQQRLLVRSSIKEENFCIDRSFHSQNRLASQTKLKSLCSIDQILLYINSKFGIINQALTNRIIQGEPFLLRIYRPYFKDIIIENESFPQHRKNYYELEIYRKDTVGHLLELIRTQSGLQTIKDFGLVLISNNKRSIQLLHDDEYVMDIIRDNNLSILLSLQKDDFQESKISIKGFFSKIREKLQSSNENQLKIPQNRIEFRKIFMLSEEVEIFSCSKDSIRLQILVEEIFYLFRNKTINLHHQNIVKLCSLFICIQYNNNLKKQDINKFLLAEIIPSSKLHLINENFLKQIWAILSIYREKNIKERNIFQTEVIRIVKDNPGWNMRFFPVENLNPTISIPDKELKIGINWSHLYVTRQMNYLTPLVKINIDKLEIKCSGFLIVVKDKQKQNENRLLCNSLFLFRSVLDKYLAYNRYFLGKDKIQGKLLMQETI